MAAAGSARPPRQSPLPAYLIQHGTARTAASPGDNSTTGKQNPARRTRSANTEYERM